MSTVANYLDFKTFIVNDLIGTAMLTYFIFLIVVIYFCLRYRADTISTLGIVIFYSLVMAIILQNVAILIITLLLVVLMGAIFASKKIGG